MGKTRRFWQRLRGSRDEKEQVAGSTTGGSGGSTDHSPAVHSTISEPNLTVQLHNQDTAKEIWLAAYKKLQEEEGTKEMVKTYETLLSKQLDSMWILNTFLKGGGRLRIMLIR